MKIKEEAAKAVLQVMQRKGLDPKKHYLEFAANNDGITVSFTNERYGKVLQFGELSVCVSPLLDTTGVIVDFGEIEGRKGLIFLGEDDVRNTNQAN
jgi:hypothetical protein